MLAGGVQRRLGSMQIQAQKFADAEASFRADLVEHPHSGWSLFGLSAALQAQGKTTEAQALKNELEQSWKLADASLRKMN